MRHGPPLPGHFEREPGRASQVHHQGADRAVEAWPRSPRRVAVKPSGGDRSQWRPPRFSHLALLGVGLVVLTSCGGTQPSRRGADAATPREGTIIYHDPVPPANAFNRKAKHSRVVRVFTTADDDIEEDSEVQVFTGQLSRNAPKGTRGSSELARRMFQRMEKSSSLRVLKPEAFAELWQSLDDAGLFKIPRSRLKKPPTDRSYFQVKTDGKEWIFSRPEVRVAGPDQPRTKYREYWGNAKRALVAFENGL